MTLTKYFLVDYSTCNIEHVDDNRKIEHILLAECSWIICQTGFELRYYDCCLLRINQVNSLPLDNDDIACNYTNITFQFDTDEEQRKQYRPCHDSGSLIEILLCTCDLQMSINTHDEQHSFTIVLHVQETTLARLLSIVMSHIDSLLEDWYPEMGTRFVQNAKGDYLINRFIPCHRCLHERNSMDKSICQAFWFETLMMFVHQQEQVTCTQHGNICLHACAPDLVRIHCRMNRESSYENILDIF
jgi:hypothetical protein